MWSASTWVTTSSSRRRLPAGSDLTLSTSGLIDPDVPPSTRMRRGLFLSLYSIQRQSPWAAGSISMRSISGPPPASAQPDDGERLSDVDAEREAAGEIERIGEAGRARRLSRGVHPRQPLEEEPRAGRIEGHASFHRRHERRRRLLHVR